MSTSTRLSGLLVALCSLAACGDAGERGEQFAKTEKLVGGAPVNTDPEVFMLDFPSAFGTLDMCTALLIGKRTLLTAGHCVDPALNPSTLPLRATNNSDAKNAPASDYIEVAQTVLHPDYKSLASAAGHDIALALLARAPEGVDPKPYSCQPLEDMGGKAVRVLGYGYTADEDYTSFGTKKAGNFEIGYIEPLKFFIDGLGAAGICNGDSGGPTFFIFGDGVERAIGVHSYTEADTCTDGVDMRVDADCQFITDTLRQWEPETPPPGDDDVSADDDVAADDDTAPADDDVAPADDDVTPADDDVVADDDLAADDDAATDDDVAGDDDDTAATGTAGAAPDTGTPATPSPVAGAGGPGATVQPAGDATARDAAAPAELTGNDGGCGCRSSAGDAGVLWGFGLFLGFGLAAGKRRRAQL